MFLFVGCPVRVFITPSRQELDARRLGRLTLWGADMWIKDQYVDIFCRWVYLPLYAILAAISLNEST